MARMIRHEQTGPQQVAPQEKAVWICMCGLSQDNPLCDGSHSKARKEEPGKLYIYDKDRQNVVETKEES